MGGWELHERSMYQCFVEIIYALSYYMKGNFFRIMINRRTWRRKTIIEVDNVATKELKETPDSCSAFVNDLLN